MRLAIPVSLLIAAAFAGCSGVPSNADPSTPVAPLGKGPLPAPMHDSKSIANAFDVQNLAQQPVCTGSMSQCQHYPFISNRTANLTAVLTWTQPGQDFDLYLMLDGKQVSNDGINNLPPGSPGELTATSQTMKARIAKGNYELLVVPWSVVQDTYTLDANFTI